MKILRTVFDETDKNKPFTFGHIQFIVKPDDVIISGWDEGFYSENNSISPHYFMKIERYEEETDEERINREDKQKQILKEMKERRYRTYLKLKEEFNP